MVTFYLVTTHNRNPFLGVDFTKAFRCFAEIRNLSTNGIPLFEAGISKEDRQMHQLTPECRSRLERVIQRFPCSTTRSRGKTSLEVHTSDTGDAAPIFDTLKKTHVFSFHAQAESSFLLVTSPILRHPVSERHFYIHCDVSDIGTGAVLFQKTNDDIYPISLHQRKEIIRSPNVNA